MNGKSALFLSTLLLSGAIALNVASVWAQGVSEEKTPGRRDTPVPPIIMMEEPGQKSEMEGSPKSPAGGGRKSTRLAEEDVKKVQEALKAEGHEPGPIDGKFGPQTQKALRSFQSARGLKDTGAIDEETLKQLGVQPREGSVPADTPPKATGN